MAAYTTHSVERRAEREIKQAYIELCLRKGSRRNIPNITSSPFNAGTHIYKHHHMGLIVLSVPNTYPPTVITTYWTVEVKNDIDHCIERFEHALFMNQKRRAEHAAKHAGPAKPMKSSRAQKNHPLHGNAAPVDSPYSQKPAKTRSRKSGKHSFN
jgi:hypothetical protein